MAAPRPRRLLAGSRDMPWAAALSSIIFNALIWITFQALTIFV
jgi:hypothetical protein